MCISGIIQQLLERLEYLFPDQMKAWRKEQNIRLYIFETFKKSCIFLDTFNFRYDRSNMPGIAQFNGKQINMATTPRALESLRCHIGDGYIARAAMAYLKASIELHSFCVE